MLDFDIYQGKQTSHDENSQKSQKGITLFYGSLFYNYFAVGSLLDNDFYVTEIIMKSRISSSIHLITEKEMMEAQRSCCDPSERNDFKVNLVYWYEQAPVSISCFKLQNGSIRVIKKESSIHR